MLHEIENLLQRLESPTQIKERHDALHLGLLLESHSRPPQKAIDPDSEVLSTHLQSIVLSRDDQLEIVDRVSALLLHSDNAGRATLFWILSKAAPEIAFGPLVRVLGTVAESLDTEASYQALLALDSHIFHDYDGSLLLTHAKVLRENDIAGFLDKLNSPMTAQRINTLQSNLDRIRQATTQ